VQSIDLSLSSHHKSDMTNVRGLDQDFWVGKVADSVRGLPPWASKFVGKLVALGGLDTIDLVLDDPERACTEETAWEPAAGCATPGAAAPHRDMPVMDKHELRESFMYGCFARCAYFDDDQDTTAVRKVILLLALLYTCGTLMGDQCVALGCCQQSPAVIEADTAGCRY
jgi:hypothetical protein